MIDASMAKVMSDARGMQCLAGKVEMGKTLSSMHLRAGPQAGLCRKIGTALDCLCNPILTEL